MVQNEAEILRLVREIQELVASVNG
jgi:hypothetical protein